MSGKGEKIIKELKINGYDYRIRHGILGHREYMINDSLNDYTRGRYGLLRVLLLGIFGPNYISAFGTFISYYIKRQYDFVEDMFVYAKVDFDTEENKCIALKVLITTNKKFGKKREMELNTTLVKLFTNQMLKKIDDSECDVDWIDFEIFPKTKKELMEDYSERLKSDEVPDDFDFYVRGMDVKKYLREHLMILKKHNCLDNFMRVELKHFPDIRKFFMTDDLLDKFSEYEEKCMDLFEKVKKSSEIMIQKG